MPYADVAVSSPVVSCRTFSYAIPSHIEATVGLAVWVPFGPRIIQGIIIQLSEYPQVEATREIVGVVDKRPVLFPSQLELARWISDYYVAPLFDSAALMLPPGFERNLVTFFHLVPDVEDSVVSSLSPDQKLVWDLLQQKGKVTLREIENDLGQRKAKLVVNYMLQKGLVRKSQELENKRVRPKAALSLRLVVEPQEAFREAERIAHRAPQQSALLCLLGERGAYVPLAEAKTRVRCSQATVQALVTKGLIAVESISVIRSPLAYKTFSYSVPPILTDAQQEALLRIQLALQNIPRWKDNSNEAADCGSYEHSHPARVFLLHGVTGSGKTEVYLRALAEAIALGKQAIVMVPEIALTPQTIERFASRFPERVAVFHSKLSLGERFDQWQLIRDGAYDVVIGSRGAIFAPQPDLGLIVIDEEHEWTYKQHDQAPRYHAREVALKLAELTGAVVILGTATPEVESFRRVTLGKYEMLELPDRISRGAGIKGALPEVDVVDLRRELKTGNRSLFSRALSRAIEANLVSKEQVILFLNRRGSYTFVQCRDCGFVLRCRSCDIPLTYHSATDALMCHQCSYRKRAVEVCPECNSSRIKFLGIGTQRVEEETAKNFPGARILRWDRDVAKGKHAHQIILDKFANHEADILIGTQMVAKGLDIPQVTLVGVISADTLLHFPDFRSCERTFQLICQVAGRAGRGKLPGRVIVQTYSPDHYAIVAASRHDYSAFYEREIGYRRQCAYPPFTQLVRLLYTHTQDSVAQKEAERLAVLLKREIDSKGMPNTSVIGPAPAFFTKLRGKFRWQIIIRGADLSTFVSEQVLPRGWLIDVDPVSLL